MDLKTVLGGVLGLAVGDALGVPVEFRSREALERNPVADMRGYGTHSQPAGTWSDDASMALCLLESLSVKGVDYEDMMSRFLRWGETGYMTPYGEAFDMGGATQNALAEYSRGKPALECGGRREYDNGNGAVMRILPLALYLHETAGSDFPERAEAYEIIHSASAVTHAHPVSKMACGFYCAAANAVLCGQDIGEALDTARAFYRKEPDFSPWLERKFARVDKKVLEALPREKVQSGGFAVHTLEAAIWCLLRHEDFRGCVLEAVNLGDDTDTTGAVAGGLAGLRCGPEGIPEEWLNVLAKRAEIEALCGQFYESLGARA